MMAQENMQEWGISPKVINETVLTAKKFLEENPEELKKFRNKFSPHRGKAAEVGTTTLAKFLGWDKHGVEEAPLQLRATGQIPEGSPVLLFFI